MDAFASSVNCFRIGTNTIKSIVLVRQSHMKNTAANIYGSSHFRENGYVLQMSSVVVVVGGGCFVVVGYAVDNIIIIIIIDVSNRSQKCSTYLLLFAV